MLTRTEISSEIGTIELQLIDAALSDEVRFSLYGAQQASPAMGAKRRDV